jgi:hypothetical protein
MPTAIISVLVLATCLFAPPAGAWEKGQIAGRVSDAKGPVRGAVVVVTGGTTRAVMTDAEGRFEIYRLVPGRGTLIVSRRGYETKIKRIRIRKSGKKRVRVRLKALPPERANECDSLLYWGGAPVCDEKGRLGEFSCLKPFALKPLRPSKNPLLNLSITPPECDGPGCHWVPPPGYWVPPRDEGPVQGVRQPFRISPAMAAYIFKPVPLCDCSCSESYKNAERRYHQRQRFRPKRKLFVP